jgi:CBS domain-containing protein
MKVRDLLKSKGLEVIAVDSSVSISQAVNKMVERNIGAVLVMEEDKLVGIFTERDALRCWVRKGGGGDFGKIDIRDVMSKDISTVIPDDDIGCVMSVMTDRNIRHLPVVEHGKVISIISIRDIVKAQTETLETEIHYLKDFIAGEYPGK